MKLWLGSLFQTNAHSLPRRLYFALLRRLLAVFGKRQSVHFVPLNNKRYKRVVFGDSYEAAKVEHALDCEPGRNRFPALIHRHENELLLAFVDGRRFEPERADDRLRLAAFYGELYAQGAALRDSAGMGRRFAVDLEFLVDAGVVTSVVADRLQQRVNRLRPGQITFGLDYVDPVAKNFVIGTGERLYAIDVESLRSNVALGSGVAKAQIHWLAPDWKAEFVAGIERASGISISQQFPYIDLCYQVGWLKRKALQGKLKTAHLELLASSDG